MPKITRRSDFVQRIFIKGIVVASVLLLTVFAVAAFSLGAKYEKVTPPPETTSPSPLYTLSQYDGKLALFKRGYSMPVEIYEVYLSSLPQAEQSKIKSGISAQTDEEILKIIEDYTS